MRSFLGRTIVLCSVVLVACADDDGSEPSTRSAAETPGTSAETDGASAATSSVAEISTTTETSTTPSTTEPVADDGADGDVGTRENPVPIGQAASVGAGWTAVVNNVNLNANDVIAAANEFNEPPVEGSVYVLANVTVTYDGDEPSDTGGVNFQAVGASNTVIDSGGSSFPSAPSPYESFTEVFKGGSLTGDVVFEVPTSDVDSLVLIGHAFASFDNAERAFFATSGEARRAVPTTAASGPSTTEPVADDGADGDVGTRENPVPIGQAASVGAGWTAVVNNVNLNANDVIAAANEFNEPPVEGSVYVLANVTVTYDGDEPSDTGGVNFQAVGGSNTVIDSGGSSFPSAPSPYESFTEVFKGGSLTGDVVFEVPTSDVDSLVLIGHAFASFDNAERAFFATK